MSENTHEKPSVEHKLLLHACCGPCSMEPTRIEREAGRGPAIYYANSNIHPAEEYEHRLETLLTWAKVEQVQVIEGPYDPAAWEATVGRIGDAEGPREARCRACYRIRFEEAARYAAEHGYTELGSTLSVSPYQYTDIIREELERACEKAGIQAHFQDYRPYYDEATRRSREAGMYRQNYCGCRFSDLEAQAEREERKRERQEKRAAYLREHAEELAAAEAERKRNRAEKKAYADKQAKKRAILKALRDQAKNSQEDAR